MYQHCQYIPFPGEDFKAMSDIMQRSLVVLLEGVDVIKPLGVLNVGLGVRMELVELFIDILGAVVVVDDDLLVTDDELVIGDDDPIDVVGSNVTVFEYNLVVAVDDLVVVVKYFVVEDK